MLSLKLSFDYVKGDDIKPDPLSFFNPSYAGDELERRLPEIAQSLVSGAIGKEEAVALIAVALEESFAETRTSKEQLDVVLRLQGVQWVLTGAEQGRIMNYVFSLTTEADKHGLS